MADLSWAFVLCAAVWLGCLAGNLAFVALIGRLGLAATLTLTLTQTQTRTRTRTLTLTLTLTKASRRSSRARPTLRPRRNCCRGTGRWLEW